MASGNSALGYLFQPGKIGSMYVRNRIIMAPLGSRLTTENGAVTDAMIEFYSRRARGGAGVITIEAMGIQYPEAVGKPNHVRFCDECYMPGHAQLTERIHECGGKAFALLWHAGLHARDVVADQRRGELPGKQPIHHRRRAEEHRAHGAEERPAGLPLIEHEARSAENGQQQKDRREQQKAIVQNDGVCAPAPEIQQQPHQQIDRRQHLRSGLWNALLPAPGSHRQADSSDQRQQDQNPIRSLGSGRQPLPE